MAVDVAADAVVVVVAADGGRTQFFANELDDWKTIPINTHSNIDACKTEMVPEHGLH
jgi:hypothetical protein